MSIESEIKSVKEQIKESLIKMLPEMEADIENLTNSFVSTNGQSFYLDPKYVANAGSYTITTTDNTKEITNTAGITTGVTSSSYVYIGDPPLQTGGSSGGTGIQFVENKPPSNTNVTWTPFPNPGYATITSPKKLEIGDLEINLDDEQSIVMWDGNSWRPLLKLSSLKEMFLQMKTNGQKEIKDLQRFDLEIEEEDQLPQELQDELLVQAFKLKLYKLLAQFK